MGYKTWSPGDVLTASDVMSYLMKQTVIVCTSGTRPTGVHGMVISETDTDRLKKYNGSAWESVVAEDLFVVGNGGGATTTMDGTSVADQSTHQLMVCAGSYFNTTDGSGIISVPYGPFPNKVLSFTCSPLSVVDAIFRVQVHSAAVGNAFVLVTHADGTTWVTTDAEVSFVAIGY